MSNIEFVDVDAKKISTSLIGGFEDAIGDTLYPGDERRIFLDQETQVIVNLKNDINETGKQNLLRYAKREVLDALGERTDTPRLPSQRAKTNLRFTLSATQAVNIIVPQGSRATPDGKLYFQTTKTLIIPAGSLTGDVLAEATEGGETHNGFVAGQIKTIVDPIAFVASVTNIDTSSSGSDIESDDSYRERIRQAPSKFSTAGPEDAYIFWAKSADVNIKDVAVTSPTPGQVKITVLLKGGQLPTQATLDSVLATCSDKRRRPLTDQVVTAAPVEVAYNINLTYYISEDKAAEENAIRSAIEDPEGSVDLYQSWQSSKLGRAINPDYLRQLMLNAGAFRINVTAPVYTEIDEDEVAKIGTITVNYGGLING